MENYVRKIIRESINDLFEVREGSSGVIGNLTNIIRNAEISFPTPSGMQKFSTDNFEIKEEIIERINSEIRKLVSIPHTSTLQNAIKLNPTFDSPRKEASLFQHREDSMYLYKLGTFWAFENGEYKKIIFNENKLKETYPLLYPYVLSSLFGIDSMFVVVYKDKFSSFGFYNSNTSDGELEIYMKKMAKKKDLPVIENGYVISGTYSKKIEIEEKKFDPETLFMNAKRAQASQ